MFVVLVLVFGVGVWFMVRVVIKVRWDMIGLEKVWVGGFSVLFILRIKSLGWLLLF